MVKDKDAFKTEFEQSSKKIPTIKKSHTFDSSQTVITVGENNMRFPFDTEEPIFSLFETNANCLKVTGGKIKRLEDMTQDACGVCRKPKAEIKVKNIT